MKTLLAPISLVLWVATVAVFGWLFFKGYTTTGSDQRRQVILSQPEKDLVLGEMRVLLSALNGVMGGLADNDPKKAAQAARSAGMGMAVDISPTLLAKLPIDFKMLGMDTHRQFDELATELDHGVDLPRALKKMNQLTANCVACHEANRI